MTQQIGITDTTTGPTVEEADMGVDHAVVLIEDADIIVALPGSGKTYYVKHRRGQAIDLDIRGSRYVLNRQALKRSMTNMAQILIDEGLQVVAHPAALDWEALMKSNPGLVVAFVLPTTQFEPLLCRRVIERGGDPAWLADAANNFRRWCARANHEKFHAARLGIRVLHYYLTPQVPYLSELWRQGVAQPYTGSSGAPRTLEDAVRAVNIPPLPFFGRGESESDPDDHIL